MQLQDFFDYKNQLMEDLLTNETIVRLIEEGAVDNPASLAYTKVFPCEYIPDTVEKGETYVCFDVDVTATTGTSPGKTFLTPILYIWVFTHRSRLRLKEGGVRTDKICAEICKAINGSRKYGLGELRIGSCKRFAPMTDTNGKMMTFYTHEFSKQYDPKREIPVNRKAGV